MVFKIACWVASARAPAERNSEISSEMARKAFKNNRRQGEISAIFARFVRVSTLEICSKKLVVAISKSHPGNVAQLGINGATPVQITKNPSVFWMYFCASVFHGFISIRSGPVLPQSAPTRTSAHVAPKLPVHAFIYQELCEAPK